MADLIEYLYGGGKTSFDRSKAFSFLIGYLSAKLEMTDDDLIELLKKRGY